MELLILHLEALYNLILTLKLKALPNFYCKTLILVFRTKACVSMSACQKSVMSVSFWALSQLLSRLLLLGSSGPKDVTLLVYCCGDQLLVAESLNFIQLRV